MNFLWDTTREVTQRKFAYKARDDGGLGALDLGLKLKIIFCKNVASAVERKAVWIGELLSWTKRKGKNRAKVPYYKLIYGDFTNKFSALNIDWCKQPNKLIYSLLCDELYGGYFPYRNLNDDERYMCVKNIQSKDISETVRDTMWLISVRRLPVRAVVKWSCFVKTVQCPVENCMEPETIEHLLLQCPRSIHIWKMMTDLGLKVTITEKAIMHGIFTESFNEKQAAFFWYIICITVRKIWLTRCKMSIEHVNIPSETVVKQIKTELRRQKSSECTRNSPRPWHLLAL